ncbi:MAG: DNA-3-methyladenine glycosylase [Paenisporosarcina sp.]
MWEENDNRLMRKVCDFNFSDILVYLNRNPKEVLHQVDLENQCVTKAVSIEKEHIIIRVSKKAEFLTIEILSGSIDTKTKIEVGCYVDKWFDLNRDLKPFYDVASQDKLLNEVVSTYKGLRIVGVEDLFEALCWAIMGQQISLHVAYSLKQKLVTTYGESLIYEDKKYWLFPTPEKIGSIGLEDLRKLSFTQRKAEYVLGVAQLLRTGLLSRQHFEGLSLEQMEKELISIRGIGKWSANYVIMRCFRHSDAFLIADVGLHNALKKLLKRDEKPTIHEIESLAEKWIGWRAYATFYLWRSLQP